jgi:uncharacterized membrane protein (DUF106 family)
MNSFNSIFGKLFEFLFLPFRSMNPWMGMIFISILTGLLMLFIFRYTSNQKGIKRVKNKIKAHLLELRLYKDSLSLSLKAQGKILLANFKYISYSTKPMLVMIIPLILILIQLNFWFAYDSLQEGQNVILKVKLKQDYSPLDTPLTIVPSSAIEIDSLPLRIERDKEIDWRLSINKNGVHDLKLSLGNQTFTKKISVGTSPLSKISPLKVEKNFLSQLTYPSEPPLPKNSPVKTIEIVYPQRNLSLFGWRIHWIVGYFLLSIIFGFALKGVFKVEI